ncbi:MAG TPA: hypothetical protein VF021_01735 [Longimicrobiales bacterium]
MSESVRHRVEVASAMAWEALADAHVAQALAFISLFDDRFTLEEALMRYIREMDMGDTMAAAVRTRVLVTLEDDAQAPEPPLPIHPADETDAETVVSDDEEGSWKRFRPDTVMRGVFQRQRKREEVERLVELAIARAEEAVIQTHVDNAITFAALLEDSGSLSRGVEQYLDSLGVVGGRGQAIAQRTMARLAEVHLPRKA